MDEKNNIIIMVDMNKSCFWCKGKIVVKWRMIANKYSEKNNLGYYTENEEDKDKYFCDKCAFKLYFNEREKIHKLMPSQKKRRHLTSYIHHKKT